MKVSKLTIRFLLFILLLIWAYMLIKSLLQSGKKKTEIRGQAKSKPLDLSKEDIEDIDFKDTDFKDTD